MYSSIQNLATHFCFARKSLILYDYWQLAMNIYELFSSVKMN